MALLGGCVDSPKWTGAARVPTAAQIKAVLGQGNSYLYYPDYEIYLDRDRRQFTYWDGGALITRSELPPGVSRTQLAAARVVVLASRETPELHRAAVARDHARMQTQAVTVTSGVP